MISLIVAIANNNVIGKGNKLPWHYKEDMKYFKEMTMNKTVIMGEMTFKSIISYLDKPLTGRKSVIATLTSYDYKGVEKTNDIISFLKKYPVDDEIFIIGGKIIYDLTLDLADRLYITHINKDFDGDIFFEDIDYSKYNKISERINGDLNFSIYERIR